MRAQKKRIESAYQATRRKAMLADYGLTEADAHLLPALLPLSPSVLGLEHAIESAAVGRLDDRGDGADKVEHVDDSDTEGLAVTAPVLSASVSSTVSTRRFRSDGFEAVDEEEARPMLLNPYAPPSSLQPLDMRSSTSPQHGSLCLHRSSISGASAISEQADAAENLVDACDDCSRVAIASTAAQSSALLADERYAELISAMHTKLSRSGEFIDLSPRWNIVAITRSIHGRAANELRELGVQVVEADLQKPETIAMVLEDAYACFVSTPV